MDLFLNILLGFAFFCLGTILVSFTVLMSAIALDVVNSVRKK